jgi:hypothetical protein
VGSGYRIEGKREESVMGCEEKKDGEVRYDRAGRGDGLESASNWSLIAFVLRLPSLRIPSSNITLRLLAHRFHPRA